MDRVVLAGLEFHGHHGVLPEETRLGGRFVVDLELEYRFADLGDDIARAVNYAEVYDTVRAEVEGPPRQLIETLAAQVARAVLAAQPRLERVTVRVHKPHAPIPGVFRDVFAELTLDCPALAGGEAASPAP